METQKSASERSYKVSFIILTVLGGLMLAAATFFEYALRGQTVAFSGFPLGAVVCLFVASLSYSKYLSVRKSNPAT